MFFSIRQVLSGKNQVSVNDHLTPGSIFEQNTFCSLVDMKQLCFAEHIMKNYNAGTSNDMIQIFCKSVFQMFQNTVYSQI